MRGSMMNSRKVEGLKFPRRIKLAAALCAIGLGLSGCVVYPSSYGYGYGGYYGGPAYYAPPVVVGVGGGWGWGGRRGWR
jgi:peptidoglycan/LPS O-acetylase OafA/YrhL